MQEWNSRNYVDTRGETIFRRMPSRNEGHAFVQVTWGFSCEFLIAEVVPISACSQGKLGTSKNGTTSTKEISTAKSSM